MIRTIFGAGGDLQPPATNARRASSANHAVKSTTCAAGTRRHSTPTAASRAASAALIAGSIANDAKDSPSARWIGINWMMVDVTPERRRLKLGAMTSTFRISATKAHSLREQRSSFWKERMGQREASPLPGLISPS